MTFEEALAWGKDGEHQIARLLMSRSVVVQPLYQHIDDKAPVLLWEVDGELAQAVLPDLTCWKAGRQFFVEVKRKRRWVHWEGRRETGFNWRLYEGYLTVERVTGAQVHVFFQHEAMEPVGVFFASLSRLTPTVRHWDGRTPDGRYIEQPLALFDARALRRVTLP